MNFQEQLAADQQRVEKALAKIAGQWPSHGELKNAMIYSLLSGGKRIRPVLVLAFCRLFGGEPEKALPFACGLEMVHTYSLIHDDLPCMDDDDVRRGKPTNHKVFGESTAVLAGDALLTAAFEVLAQAELSSEQIVRGTACLAKAAGPAGMVGGQVLDILGEGKRLSREDIVTIESLKTGCLIEAAARLGTIAAGGTEKQEAIAAAFARKIGLAFQVRDDILDVEGNEEEFGKPIGSDAEKEKSTFVTLMGLEACRELTDRLTAEAKALLKPLSGSDFLCFLAEMLAGRSK